MFHYNDLRKKFIDSKSVTRNKSLLMPEINKSINLKNNEIVAMKLFNEFPNELKTLNLSNKNLKTKITNWYKEGKEKTNTLYHKFCKINGQKFLINSSKSLLKFIRVYIKVEF